MDASRVSSLSIRLAAAIEVEPVPLLDAHESVVNAKQTFLDYVRVRANQATTLDERSLGAFLHKLVQDISNYEFGELGEAGRALFESKERLTKRLSGGCGRCRNQIARVAAGHRVCTSATDPHHQACIEEVLAFAAGVESRARDVYRQCVPTLRDTEVELAFEHAHAEESRALYQQFSTSGWTELVGPQAVRIGLAIRDGAFDRDALKQTLYILAHEFSCHAFQGIGGELRPQVADERCSWSEGWMDAMAWTLTEAWIQDDGDILPNGFLAFDVRDNCLALHMRRYTFPQPGNMKRPHLNRRQEARTAFHTLREALSQGQNKTPGPTCEATRFSILLNVAPLQLKQRDELATLLCKGLLAGTPLRQQRTADACRSYLDHQDVELLEIDLREAAHGLLPSGITTAPAL